MKKPADTKGKPGPKPYLGDVVPVSILIPREIHARMAAQALSEQISLSSLIRKIIINNQE